MFVEIENIYLKTFTFPRTAVAQRKMVSRTSSNILLNSVHIQNMNQLTTLQNNNLQASDCDLGGIIIKETQYQDTHSELSDLEVSRLRLLIIVYFYITTHLITFYTIVKT